ncbi:MULTISPECIES: hypothetical protein [unclassified Nocardioides]|uniref:hypothetical protein n=1 Tax=unclassified Nocardioides TaxID=2615069 RepID=UPI003014A399
MDATARPPGRAQLLTGARFYFDADLRPVRPLNDWLTEISTAHPLETVKSYGYEVARFSDFLEVEFDTTLLGEDLLADGDRYLRAYNAHLVRPEALSSDSLAPKGASRSVVGKVRAALHSFYRFCTYDRRIESFPFTLVTTSTRYGDIETLAYMRGGRITDPFRDPIPSSQLDDYYFVGLLGTLPDGSVDTGFGSWQSAQRNAAGFGLGVGLGLRHREILGTTIFEVPRAHPDGLTPARVAGGIAKGGHSRKVVGLSQWLLPVHRYISGDRRSIARRATWRPERAWVVDPMRTTQFEVVVETPNGRHETHRWNDLNHEQRARLMMPRGGSPMVLLDHSKKNGAPLRDDDSLNSALALAGRRCQQHWPALDWSYTAHHLRHTFATELTMLLAESDQVVANFKAQHGRPPVWASMLMRQDKSRIVQDSMGHRSVTTTHGYNRAAMWSLLISVAADPEHNPAIREERP